MYSSISRNFIWMQNSLKIAHFATFLVLAVPLSGSLTSIATRRNLNTIGNHVICINLNDVVGLVPEIIQSECENCWFSSICCTKATIQVQPAKPLCKISTPFFFFQNHVSCTNLNEIVRLVFEIIRFDWVSRYNFALYRNLAPNHYENLLWKFQSVECQRSRVMLGTKQWLELSHSPYVLMAPVHAR